MHADFLYLELNLVRALKMFLGLFFLLPNLATLACCPFSAFHYSVVSLLGC